ncbi:hypothetical protein AAKU55_005513 [Oxalobacteraceae bacterium GrIS 1.11]
MSIKVAGVTYTLTHLNTQTHTKVPMEDSRGVPFEKHVMVVYSSHCYSTGEKAGIPFSPPADALIWDGPRRRQFDLTRYNLSLILPKIVTSMLYSPHAVVWDTGWGNRHYSELIGSPNINAGHPYYVFMRVQKEKINNGPYAIKLAVESAYPVVTPNIRPKQSNMLPIRQWLGKTWAGKP